MVRPVLIGRVLVGCLVSGAALGLALPGAVGAQEASAAEASASMPVTWGVHPVAVAGADPRPNFDLEAAPGDTISDALVVVNPSAVNLLLGVYASDAFNTEEGGTDLLAADSELVDVGRWTEPEQSSVTVPAGGSVTVPFTVTVPEDADAGDHVGGIVTSLTVAEPDSQGNRIDVERRIGSRIYVRVEGGVAPELTFTQLEVDHHASWNPFAAGSLTVRYSVENTGNVRLRATRLVRVSPTLGSERTAEAADMPELLPGNSYEFSHDVSGVWPGLGTDVEVELGPYETTGAELDPAPAASVARSRLHLWPVPQAIGLVVLVLVVIGVLRRRRSTRSAAAPATSAAPAASTTATSPSANPPAFPPPLSPDRLGPTGGQLYTGDAP